MDSQFISKNVRSLYPCQAQYIYCKYSQQTGQLQFDGGLFHQVLALFNQRLSPGTDQLTLTPACLRPSLGCNHSGMTLVTVVTVAREDRGSYSCFQVNRHAIVGIKPMSVTPVSGAVVSELNKFSTPLSFHLSSIVIPFSVC